MGGAKADNGSGANGVKIEKSATKKVRIYTQPGAPVDVAIIDADGNVLYKGAITANKQGATSFNLNSLPDGQYFMTAANKSWWMSQALTIKGNTVNVDERSLQEVTQPTVTTYDKNKVEVTLPSKNVSEASVAIYDAQSILVYADKLTSSVRRFDLSSLPEGAYTFVVGPDQKQFSSRINIQR